MPHQARSHVRTALFVDFDNMYLNLRSIDPTAGEAFATEPDRWLRWMHEDMGQIVPDATEGTSREILIRQRQEPSEAGLSRLPLRRPVKLRSRTARQTYSV